MSTARGKWLIALATLASVCSASVVVAHALHTSLVGSPTASSDSASPSGDDSALRAHDPHGRSPSARRIGERILARNIFDSQTGPLAWDRPLAPPPAPKPVPAAPVAGPPPSCELGLRLVGSMVNTLHPERSVAAIRKGERTHLLLPGSQVEHLTLLAVRATEAYLRSADGAVCKLIAFTSRGEPTTSVAAPPPAPAPASKPKRKSFFSDEELERGVRPVGRNGYAVSRELVLRALTDPGKAAPGAHFKPARREGHGAGMEVRALRDDALLRRIGVQNGDVVRSLNGADLTTATGLLDAVRTLRESDTVTLRVVRDDAAQDITYFLD